MPGLDQTGPQGQGSMTGRRRGRCANAGTAIKRGEGTATQPEEEKAPGGIAGKGNRQGSGRGIGGSGQGGRGAGQGRGQGAGQGRGQGLQKRLRGNV